MLVGPPDTVDVYKVTVTGTLVVPGGTWKTFVSFSTDKPAPINKVGYVVEPIVNEYEI